MVEICPGGLDYDMKTDWIILFIGVFIITMVLLWPILSGIRADIRNMQFPVSSIRPHYWNPPLGAVAMKADNQTKPLCDKECPTENWGYPLQISSLHMGNLSNSTDGGKCLDNICQVSLSQSQHRTLVEPGNLIASGPIQSDVHQVSIYICGHFKNGTKEWCWLMMEMLGEGLDRFFLPIIIFACIMALISVYLFMNYITSPTGQLCVVNINPWFEKCF